MNLYKVYYVNGTRTEAFDVKAEKYFTVDNMVIFKVEDIVMASFSLHTILGVTLQKMNYDVIEDYKQQSKTFEELLNELE